MPLEDMLAQYGLTGLVILIFYYLMRNDLSHLRDEITNLREAIDRLREAILTKKDDKNG